ncbi:MAG: hypothetical protein JKX76_02185 [Colwellia sp.]|nr:hypothetical protein [Colwellia sp.]
MVDYILKNSLNKKFAEKYKLDGNVYSLNRQDILDLIDLKPGCPQVQDKINELIDTLDSNQVDIVVISSASTITDIVFSCYNPELFSIKKYESGGLDYLRDENTIIDDRYQRDVEDLVKQSVLSNNIEALEILYGKSPNYGMSHSTEGSIIDYLVKENNYTLLIFFMENDSEYSKSKSLKHFDHYNVSYNCEEVIDRTLFLGNTELYEWGLAHNEPSVSELKRERKNPITKYFPTQEGLDYFAEQGNLREIIRVEKLSIKENRLILPSPTGMLNAAKNGHLNILQWMYNYPQHMQYVIGKKHFKENMKIIENNVNYTVYHKNSIYELRYSYPLIPNNYVKSQTTSQTLINWYKTLPEKSSIKAIQTTESALPCLIL